MLFACYLQNIFNATMWKMWIRYFINRLSNESKGSSVSCELFFMCFVWIAIKYWWHSRYSWWTCLLLWTLWARVTIVSVFLNLNSNWKMINSCFLFSQNVLISTEKPQICHFNKCPISQQPHNKKDDLEKEK